MTLMPVNTDALAIAHGINKKYGEGTISLASEMKRVAPFPSGSLDLDLRLGGGWPANRWVEVVGLEQHGKSALVLKSIAANQARDLDFTTVWVAAEPYDTDQAEALGVENSRVIVIDTQDMTFAYEMVLDFISKKSVDCVVIDSYPALIPSEEEAKTMDDIQVSLGARHTGKFFRKLGSAMRREDVDRPFVGFFINQYRDKIGSWSPMGTPKTTPGGNAKNYAFYTRVEVKRDEWIEEKEPGKEKVKVGQVIKVRTIKNKAAPPQQVATLRFFFADAPQHGFKRGDYDLLNEIFTLALEYDIILRRGKYYTYADKQFMGREAALDGLRDDPDLAEQVEREVRRVALHA